MHMAHWRTVSNNDFFFFFKIELIVRLLFQQVKLTVYINLKYFLFDKLFFHKWIWLAEAPILCPCDVKSQLIGKVTHDQMVLAMHFARRHVWVGRKVHLGFSTRHYRKTRKNFFFFCKPYLFICRRFIDGSESACQYQMPVWSLGSRRYPGGGNGKALQDSWKNSMNRGA